jgi:hypothetical protein
VALPVVYRPKVGRISLADSGTTTLALEFHRRKEPSAAVSDAV